MTERDKPFDKVFEAGNYSEIDTFFERHKLIDSLTNSLNNVCPKGFDKNYASNLDSKTRRESIKRTVPRDKILGFQRANVKTFGTEIFLKVPGFIGFRKDPGTFYINLETGQIHFVNDHTNKWRTTV